jgi:hypothetical protein
MLIMMDENKRKKLAVKLLERVFESMIMIAF